jgi:signal transduction histidine kinase
MNVRQLIPKNRRAEMLALTKRLIKGEDIQSFETQRVAKDGRIVEVWLTITILTDDAGKPTFVATTERDITERKRLEEEMLEIPMREREQIGREMHDNLGQMLTGIAVKSKGLELKLKSKSLEESADAAAICKLANKLIAQTRRLAFGSRSYNGKTSLSHCPGSCDQCGQTRQLASDEEKSVLTVKNDGKSFPKVSTNKEGLGLKIMDYRARTIGGSLHVHSSPEGGTVATVIFPHRLTSSVKGGHYDRKKTAK